MSAGMWGHGGLYADWAVYLEQWAADVRPAPAVPSALKTDDFDSDTWTRLMMRIQDAVNTRMQRWSDQLSRNLAEARDEFSWGRALTQSRDGLRAVLGFCAMRQLPAEIRDALSGQVRGIISANQKTLETDASRDLGGPRGGEAEMQLRQLRQSPLTAVLSDPMPTFQPNYGSKAVTDQPTQSDFRPSRRRIIIDPAGDS